VRSAIIATLLSVMFALPAAAETSPRPLRQGHVLADLLKQQVPKAPVPPVELQTMISDYEILNDQSYFMVGFYTFHPDTESILPPLRVLLLDKQSDTWRHLEIQDKLDADGVPENGCLGTVLRIKPIGEKFFLETHMTPSASCQFVLSRSLKLEHILFGWPMEGPPSGRLLIEGNTAHFAKTHPPSLSLYDPATATETSLLPLADDSSMKWLDDDLSDLIDQSWCAENNSPCEASGLSGAPLAFFVNDKSNAVAIDVQYIGGGMGPRAENFKADVIYVFDLSGKTLQHREFKPVVVQKMIGNYDMEKLTQPSALRQLFTPDSALR
jgi:hypothetical protein